MYPLRMKLMVVFVVIIAVLVLCEAKRGGGRDGRGGGRSGRRGGGRTGGGEGGKGSGGEGGRIEDGESGRGGDGGGRGDDGTERRTDDGEGGRGGDGSGRSGGGGDGSSGGGGGGSSGRSGGRGGDGGGRSDGEGGGGGGRSRGRCGARGGKGRPRPRSTVSPTISSYSGTCNIRIPKHADLNNFRVVLAFNQPVENLHVEDFSVAMLLRGNRYVLTSESSVSPEGVYLEYTADYYPRRKPIKGKCRCFGGYRPTITATPIPVSTVTNTAKPATIPTKATTTAKPVKSTTTTNVRPPVA